MNDATSVELQGQRVTGTAATLRVARSTTLELRAHGAGGDASTAVDVLVDTTISVMGRVTDERGSPLANVNLVILEDPVSEVLSTRDAEFSTFQLTKTLDGPGPSGSGIVPDVPGPVTSTPYVQTLSLAPRVSPPAGPGTRFSN